jgi:CPA2 family monovalent cation:H+ antiporter-2
MGLAQIGEFSFIIATLGLTLNVTSDFLYPIAVAVSAITTLLTPYLIKLANPLSVKITESTPKPITNVFKQYRHWLKKIQPEGRHADILKVIGRIIVQIGVNFALVATVFLTAAYLGSFLTQTYFFTKFEVEIRNTLIWGLALIISLPFIIVAYQKLHVLSILFAELITKTEKVHTKITKKIATEIIPIVFVIAILFAISAVSFSIFPPVEMLLIVLVVAGLLAFVLWKWFIRLHSKLQMSFLDTING